MFIGAQLAGRLYNSFLAGQSTLAMADWTQFWMIMGAMALVVAVFFAMVFREDRTLRKPGAENVPGAEPISGPGV
jgi:hypothetical protein